MVARTLRFLLGGLAILVMLPCVAWAAGALYFDLPAPSLVRIICALAWLFGCLALVILSRRRWRSLAIIAAGFAAITAWWLTIPPRQDRDWKPEVAVLAFATREGDRVTIHNVRNFEYRTETDFTPHYDTRTYDLGKLRGIDLFLNYWGSLWMAHPIISFDFAEDGRIAFSIETRPEKGEGFSAIGGLYRMFELIYIPADERDVVRVRSNYRQGEDVYLYHLTATPETARERFLEYIERLNELHARPAWYHAITNNCTTSIRVQRTAAKRAPWDRRLLANGKADEWLYEQGAIDRTLPFAELKRRALIDERARAANDDPDFSTRIRAGLPGF